MVILDKLLNRAPGLFLIGPFCLVLMAAYFAAGQTPNKSKDTSPHKSQTVSVGAIRLHYLDWGGEGEALLFISGAGDTAHAFDKIAPKFTDQFRVLALTRRGFGESDKPEKGYDVPTLAEDVRLFLDAMKIQRVHLIGHSAGGNEMIYFAGRYPKRTRKLVFLDAAYDRREVPTIEAKDPLAETPRTKPSNQISLSERIESEYFREMFSFKPNFKRLKAPTLNFYAIFEKHWALKADMDEATKLRAQKFIEEFVQPYQNKNIERFRKDVRHANIVLVRGSNHYFYRDPKKIDEVVATVRRFLEDAKPAPLVNTKKSD